MSEQRTSGQEWYQSVYLKSDHWFKTRDRKLQSCDNKCEGCGSKSKLQIHHLSYKNVWKEPDSDLKVLCNSCHESTHLIMGDCVQVKPNKKKEPDQKITLTKKLIYAGATDSWGFKRAQVACFGVKWPLAKGWLDKLVGYRVSQKAYERFLSYKGKGKPKK